VRSSLVVRSNPARFAYHDPRPCYCRRTIGRFAVQQETGRRPRRQCEENVLISERLKTLIRVGAPRTERFASKPRLYPIL
jgi:hypothetical protein